MHWRDKSDTVSFLEEEDRYGYGHDQILASVRLVFGEWQARRRNDTIIGKFPTEDEAKAVTLVTIRMEQADESRLEPATRRPHIFISRKR